MPVYATIEHATGRPAFRSGLHGRVYAYQAGDRLGESRARMAAQREERRARSRGGQVISGPGGSIRLDSIRRRIQPPRYPRAIEQRYAAQLLRQVRLARDLLMGQIGDILKPAPAPRQDAAGDQPGVSLEDAGRIRSIVSVVRELVVEAVPDLSEDLSGLAAGVDAFTSGEQARILHAVATITTFNEPSAALYAGFVSDNVSLITSIHERYFGEIEELVSEAVRTGQSMLDLRDQIEDRYGVSQSRAKLIARDQVGKLNGDITRQRQTELGVTHYMWSSSGDERVRSLHRELDGQVFAWADPPESGTNGERMHPGGPIQCRCVAIPVLGPADEAALVRGQEARVEQERALGL